MHAVQGGLSHEVSPASQHTTSPAIPHCTSPGLESFPVTEKTLGKQGGDFVATSIFREQRTPESLSPLLVTAFVPHSCGEAPTKAGTQARVHVQQGGAAPPCPPFEALATSEEVPVLQAARAAAATTTVVGTGGPGAATPSGTMAAGHAGVATFQDKPANPAQAEGETSTYRLSGISGPDGALDKVCTALDAALLMARELNKQQHYWMLPSGLLERDLRREEETDVQERPQKWFRASFDDDDDESEEHGQAEMEMEVEMEEQEEGGRLEDAGGSQRSGWKVGVDAEGGACESPHGQELSQQRDEMPPHQVQLGQHQQVRHHKEVQQGKHGKQGRQDPCQLEIECKNPDTNKWTCGVLVLPECKVRG